MLDQPLIADRTAERESARLKALERYDILGTPPEASFDRITRLTRKLFSVPVAIISFIDGHRQWYKASEGLTCKEVPKEKTFCQHVVAEGKPIIVPDATLDPQFQQNEHVVNDPGVRFYAGIPLTTDDGHHIGVFCIVDTVPRRFEKAEIEVMQDLAMMAMGALELRLTANKDGLTGALSRRAFKEEVAHAAALALRHHHDLSVVALDLDHFKSINDTHGHAAGDLVLQRTVQCCADQLRSTDLIGRLGGEEFAVLLPNTGRATAIQVAEKMRAAIEHQRILFKDKFIKLSASFGIAWLDYDVRDVETLLERADQALYSAKSAGRNRCTAPQGSDVIRNDVALRRVFKAGQIVFNGRGSTMNCTVRLLSERGARLDVSNSTGVPSRFSLIIKSDDFDRPCRIAAQTEKNIDVHFC